MYTELPYSIASEANHCFFIHSFRKTSHDDIPFWVRISKKPSGTHSLPRMPLSKIDPYEEYAVKKGVWLERS